MKPTKRALDDPTLRLNLESTRRSADQLDDPRPTNPGPSRRGLIRPVGPEDTRELDMSPEHFESELAAVAVLNVGGRDNQCPDQTECINDEMPFAADDFFSPHRSHAVRLARSSSRSDCRGWQPTAWAICPPAAAHARAAWSAVAPRCRRVATAESSETRCDREADRAASCAKCNRCARGTGLRSPLRDARSWPDGRPAWALAPTARYAATVRP